MNSQNSKQHTNVVAVQPQTTFHKEDRMKNHSSLSKKTLLAAVIMACLIVPATMSAQTCTGGTAPNKVLNGGFQTGSGYTITDWSVAFSSSSDPYVEIEGNGQGGSSQALWMGSDSGENRVFQAIPGLTAGHVYFVCFYLSNGATSSPNSFAATWNDQNVVQLINSESFGYTYFSFLVTATGNDVLSFEARNSPSYWYIDNVAVELCSGCTNNFSLENGTKSLPSSSE